MNMILVLWNIRSVYNVASIFRTADAAGVGKIFLVGTTPAPLDRFGNFRKDFAKVSLGAERAVKWEKINEARGRVSGVGKLFEKLKKRRVQNFGSGTG